MQLDKQKSFTGFYYWLQILAVNLILRQLQNDNITCFCADVFLNKYYPIVSKN